MEKTDTLPRGGAGLCCCLNPSRTEARAFNRRDLIRSSLLLAGAPFPCCTTPEVPPTAVKIEEAVVVIDLKNAPELRRPGSAARIIDRHRRRVIIIVHSEKNRFVALNGSCTHGSADLAYNRRHGTVQCTSLGHSEFALEGAVLRGPAPRPLRTYRVRLAGSRLEIALEDGA